jgi:hypothetical protein
MSGSGAMTNVTGDAGATSSGATQNSY